MLDRFVIEGYPDYTFRPKKMTAFEMLALQTQVGFDNSEKAEKFFKLCLEYIEVECKNAWVPCKQKGLEMYAPVELETNVDLLKKLIDTFMNEYLLEVFTKSGDSSKEQQSRSPD